MRITGLALGLVVLAATACQAETPELSGGSQLFSRGRLGSAQTWWTRYGEAVNADGKDAGPAIHGDYVYGPGSCDCPPPCIDQLWSGYYQHPKRCNPYVGLFHRHGCGDGCGNGCGKGCGLFGHGKGCGCGDGVSCTTKAACGCAAPVTCTTAPDCGCKPSCGCKHAHLGHKWKHFMAHWGRDCCDSCSAPLGCGCATPIAPYAPQVQVPSEKQAFVRPQPLADEAVLIALPRLN